MNFVNGIYDNNNNKNNKLIVLEFDGGSNGTKRMEWKDNEKKKREQIK